jgi:hypothetical protein
MIALNRRAFGSPVQSHVYCILIANFSRALHDQQGDSALSTMGTKFFACTLNDRQGDSALSTMGTKFFVAAFCLLFARNCVDT